MAGAIVDTLESSTPLKSPPWGFEDEQTKRTITSMRTVLDYAAANPHFDKDKLGVIGLSLGGINAAILAGVEPERLKAVVIAAGGGNLPKALSESTSGKLKSVRDMRMKEHSITSSTDYEEHLRETIKFDPIYFAPHAVRDSILMFIAEKDTTVPYETQAELFDAFKQPSYITISTTHIPALLAFTYLYFDTVLNFLDMRFMGETATIRMNVQRTLDQNHAAR
jgi:dienelactone hydrolase